jgi:hypothetical protein
MSKELLITGWKHCKANRQPEILGNMDPVPEKAYYIQDNNDKGYLAVYPDRLIISIDGSDDLIDWKENADIAKDTDSCHTGFSNPARDMFEKAYKPHILENPKRKISIRAHSRGGAIAIRMVPMIHQIQEYISIDCYVYGTPAVGGERFKKIFIDTLPDYVSILRIEMEYDPVPKLLTEECGFVKESPVLKIKQPWWWRFPWGRIFTHTHYGYMIQKFYKY